MTPSRPTGTTVTSDGQRRPKIRGHDLALGYEARLWLLIVGSYSLLEQCLKLLVGIRTSGYLSQGAPDSTGKPRKPYAVLQDLRPGEGH